VITDEQDLEHIQFRWGPDYEGLANRGFIVSLLVRRIRPRFVPEEENQKKT
jgi:hypothetical protein